MADEPRHPSIVQKIGKPNLFIRHFPNSKAWIPAIQNFSGAEAYVDRVMQRPLVLGCQGIASPLMLPRFPVSAGAPLEKRIAPILANFIVGGTFVVACTATAPINRVKLLMQSQNEMIKSGRLSMPYKGIMDCFARTVRNEGIISLWRGNTMDIIRYLSVKALHPVKSYFIGLFSYKDDYGYWKAPLVETGVSCALTSILYPLEYAQTRLANDIKAPGKAGRREFKGMVDVYRKTLNSDGIAGLYRGFNISLVERIVSLELSAGLLRSLKPVILLHGLQHSILTAFIAGVGTTVCGGFATYPMNTVFNRMMMTSGKDVKYKSSLDAFNQIIKNEDIKSLYKGAGAYILITTAFAAFRFGCYNILVYLLEPEKKNESDSGVSPDADGPSYNLRIRWK